jgi:multidrug efflux pump subunit AcrA (membrane-fusion protein)
MEVIIVVNKIVALLALSISVVIIACANHKQSADAVPKAIVSVKFESVSKGSIALEEIVSGHTDVKRRNRIVSPIAGKIIAIRGIVGARVHKGEIVAVIRTKGSDAAISGARTLYSHAQTRKQKIETKRMVDLAINTQNVVNLKSPINGVITILIANVGDMVAENADILTVIDPSTMVFIAEAPIVSLQKLRIGQSGTVQFDALPDSSYPVTILSIGAESDSQSQRVEIISKFTLPVSNTATLKTDMPGSARIITGIHANTFLVQRSALLRNDETNTYSVITITPDSLSRTIIVTVGASRDSIVEIFGKSIFDGMPVITQGNYALAESTRVTASREKP